MDIDMKDIIGKMEDRIIDIVNDIKNKPKSLEIRFKRQFKRQLIIELSDLEMGEDIREIFGIVDEEAVEPIKEELQKHPENFIDNLNETDVN
jgi:hypothetical protein